MTPKILLTTALLSMAFVLGSCRNRHLKSEAIYEDILRQGYTEFEYVNEIRSQFDAISFIANYGNDHAVPQWQTVFYVSDWFECVYAQDLSIEQGKVTLVGGPQLHVNEISSIDGHTISYARQKILQSNELKEFIESNFDLKEVGLPPYLGRLAPVEDLMRYWHELYPGQ